MQRTLNELIGHPVVVQTGDLRYRGVLREVTAERVSLRGPTGWREIPMDRIVAIRPAEEA